MGPIQFLSILLTQLIAFYLILSFGIIFLIMWPLVNGQLYKISKIRKVAILLYLSWDMERIMCTRF